MKRLSSICCMKGDGIPLGRDPEISFSISKQDNGERVATDGKSCPNYTTFPLDIERAE